MVLGVLSNTDLFALVIICLTVLMVLGFARGRGRTTFALGKGSVTIEDVHNTIKEVEKHVGVTNGDGSLSQMGERILAESAETKAEVAALRSILDDRTHVRRDGTDVPVELALYMKDWFHRINSQQTVIISTIAIMWEKMRKEHGLPELPILQREGEVA